MTVIAPRHCRMPGREPEASGENGSRSHDTIHEGRGATSIHESLDDPREQVDRHPADRERRRKRPFAASREVGSNVVSLGVGAEGLEPPTFAL